MNAQHVVTCILFLGQELRYSGDSEGIGAINRIENVSIGRGLLLH